MSAISDTTSERTIVLGVKDVVRLALVLGLAATAGGCGKQDRRSGDGPGNGDGLRNDAGRTPDGVPGADSGATDAALDAASPPDTSAPGDASAADTSAPGDAPGDASVDVVVAIPPALSSCRTFVQDFTSDDCNLDGKPDDNAIAALAFSLRAPGMASTSGKHLNPDRIVSGVTEAWSVSGLDLHGGGGYQPDHKMNALAYSRDSRVLATAGESGEIDVFTAPLPSSPVVFGVVDPDPTVQYRWISISADNDRVLTVRPLASALEIWSISGNGRAGSVSTSPVAAVAASTAPPADGSWWVAVASTSNTISFFDLNAAEVKATTPFPVGVVRSVALSDDTRTLAVASDDSLRLWDVSDKQYPRALSPALMSSDVSPNDFQLAAFAPSGRYLLATAPRTGVVVLFDVEQRVAVRARTFRGQPQAIAWSRDGQAIAIGANCGRIYYCRD